MFLHAKDPGDMQEHHLVGKRTVILVDLVVNSGKSVVQFARRIRTTCPGPRIVVVAGVAQSQSATRTLAIGSSIQPVWREQNKGRYSTQGVSERFRRQRHTG
ncbi:hypothetical protein RRF57_009101 [Xylaria bambusicola]|uniref:Phosphoribosyltransferase domain-containing protein n=1 Tax=Xylaria bambusicola TaxID=326684 RepID=A0AAN7UQE7_9PEZI